MNEPSNILISKITTAITELHMQYDGWDENSVAYTKTLYSLKRLSCKKKFYTQFKKVEDSIQELLYIATSLNTVLTIIYIMQNWLRFCKLITFGAESVFFSVTYIGRNSTLQVTRRGGGS